MEDKKFPENSNSEIIDTGPPIESSVDPPVSNTGDPSDDSSLDRGSPSDSHSKVSAFFSKAITQLKQTTILQRALVCLVVLALVISTATGVLIYGGSSGTTSGSSSGEFSIDGNCEGEIVYYPFYMISPMKLFYYYSVYDEDSRQKGAAVLRGKSREDEGLAKPVVLKAKNYKLQPNEYYGNTIAGYSDGTLVMTSNAMYTYRDANGNHLAMRRNWKIMMSYYCAGQKRNVSVVLMTRSCPIISWHFQVMMSTPVYLSVIRKIRQQRVSMQTT